MQIGKSLAYWVKVVSLGAILGIGLQFAQAWVAPTVAPPGGNVSGPVTISGNQTKTGSLTTTGLSAPSFVDSDNAARFVNPSGSTALTSLSLSSSLSCTSLKTDASGAISCGVSGGTGTVTSVATGTGLTGGPVTGSGTISADTSYLQRRVTGTCAGANQSIKTIAADGTVTCEADDTGVGAPGNVVGGCGAFNNNGGGSCSPLFSCWGGASVTYSCLAAASSTCTVSSTGCPTGSTMRRTGVYSIGDCGGDGMSAFSGLAFICVQN